MARETPLPFPPSNRFGLHGRTPSLLHPLFSPSQASPSPPPLRFFFFFFFGLCSAVATDDLVVNQSRGLDITKLILEALEGEKFTSSTSTVALLVVTEPFHIVDDNIIQELIISLKIEEGVADSTVTFHFGEEVATNNVL
ncbi:hypothetical protein Scep_017212 [Stephania cephalantha]|uniref:Uncharacterized protein n=1 Tax=Stephania cephalantha TaxID=152367 RepID=A0AAP0IP58_9MAGN